MGSTTIYHDGSLWIGLFVREEEGQVYAARHVFGPEPGGAEILDFLTYRYDTLRFIPVDSGEIADLMPRRAGFKKSLKQARKEQAAPPEGRARQAFREAQKNFLQEKKGARREQARRDVREEYRRKQERKKQKRRGH